MELHQLRYVVAVADLGSFTRAAESCRVAQPSLSQQIQKLERELGQPLFERLGRTVRLTDAGRSLYEQAVPILQAVEDARRRISDGTNGGRAAIGAIPTVAPYLLPPLMKSFLKRHPNAEVRIHEVLTADVIRGCLTGEIDVGLLALPIEEDRLHVESLFEEELLLAAPSGHRLAQKSRVTMKDVGREPFILLDEAHCLGEHIVRFCKQQECLPAVSCHSAQLLTVQELVALNHGVSLVPAMACRADRSSRRTYRSLSGQRPTRTLAMIWRKDRYQGPLVRQFIETVREDAVERNNG